MSKIDLKDRQAPLATVSEEDFQGLVTSFSEDKYNNVIWKYLGNEANPHNYKILDLKDSKEGCICHKDANPLLWPHQGYFILNRDKAKAALEKAERNGGRIF